MHHLLNAFELEFASFYHCNLLLPSRDMAERSLNRRLSSKQPTNQPILSLQKMVYHIVCCEKWCFILIETINKSVKSVLRHRRLIYFTGNFFQCGISSYNQIMSSKHIPPKLPGHLLCFLLTLKRQCIRVSLCKLVWCANKWSYRYWILFLDR